jgi:hypothetical protein
VSTNLSEIITNLLETHGHCCPMFSPSFFLSSCAFSPGPSNTHLFVNDILQLKQTNYLFPLQQCAFSWVSMNKRVWQQPRLNEFGLVFPPSLTLSLSLSVSLSLALSLCFTTNLGGTILTHKNVCFFSLQLVLFHLPRS